MLYVLVIPMPVKALMDFTWPWDKAAARFITVFVLFLLHRSCFMHRLHVVCVPVLTGHLL